MAPVRCPVCGASHAVCGPATGATVQPIDTPTVKEPAAMAELHHYETQVNGHRTTLRLSEADAKKRGLTKKASPAKSDAPAPLTSKSTGAK